MTQTTPGQAQAIDQLQEIESVSNGELEIIDISGPTHKSSSFIANISVDCDKYRAVREDEGLPLRERERFHLYIPPNFPFEIPSLYSQHTRFHGFGHVQWGNYLCLYLAPDTEWNPSDGMYGYMDRFDDWLLKGAQNQLDPTGAPLHPPVAYAGTGPRIQVIPSVDTPPVEGKPWVGFADIIEIRDHYFKITGWHESESSIEGKRGAAILLNGPMPFEYPRTVAGIINKIIELGVSLESILFKLSQAAINNETGDPLFVVVGAPMRGISGDLALKQHLCIWYIEPEIATNLALTQGRYLKEDKWKEVGEKAKDAFIEWANEAKTNWCNILENRSEIITRRDYEASLSWFNGRSVAIWGCGALGSHVAEYLVRAGVSKMTLRDNGIVSPGLLVRQPYLNEDLGKYKVHALSQHLMKINPELVLDSSTDNLLQNPMGHENWPEDADVIIDTTASLIVSQCLELKLRDTEGLPPIASMMIGHDAARGVVVLSRPDHSGGPQDVFRRAKLAACHEEGLEEWLEDFWPEEPRTRLFQPEPGCSDATFVGSQADVASLAGIMLNRIAEDVAEEDEFTASAHFVTTASFNHVQPTQTDFAWLADQTVVDAETDYEVRIPHGAWHDLMAEISRSKRVNGPETETGGVLFGEYNHAARVIWVDEVIGPPPDSECAPAHFMCGVEGVASANDEKEKRTKGSVKYMGTWHTHPVSVAVPSSTDIGAMMELALTHDPPHVRALLLILGNVHQRLTVGAYLFKRSDFEKSLGSGLLTRTINPVEVASQETPQKIGLALSGGGSRAIAFHLGCLRALNDRGILEQIKVISGVSGGSVIGALYAYSDGTFEEFDAKVVKILQHGLVGKIAQKWLLSPRIVKSIAASFTAGLPAVAVDMFRWISALFIKFIPGVNPKWLKSVQPPFRRWASRSHAFEAALETMMFKDKKLTDKRRDDIDIVINACELRTGSAFRFGNRESGCYRFGRIKDNNLPVSKAVAASAAFPLLFPAFDVKMTFVTKKDEEELHRILLTDGGVYDNLGLTALDPSRSSKYSYNVFAPDYIISCSAGAGILDSDPIPSWWPTRMIRTFDSIYRKFQDQGYGFLHQIASAGQIKGFVLSYLGQIDYRLPYTPPDLVRREQVCDYPTDFSPMSRKDIRMLTDRGEQLTRLLLSRYCPEL